MEKKETGEKVSLTRITHLIEAAYRSAEVFEEDIPDEDLLFLFEGEQEGEGIVNEDMVFFLEEEDTQVWNRA